MFVIFEEYLKQNWEFLQVRQSKDRHEMADLKTDTLRAFFAIDFILLHSIPICFYQFPS